LYGFIKSRNTSRDRLPEMEINGLRGKYLLTVHND
jgi:hypothetical protein